MPWSPPPAPWQRGRFLLGDLAVPGWHLDQRWVHGGIAWYCPWFDRQTTQRITRWIERHGGQVTYEATTDTWTVQPAPGFPTITVQGHGGLWPGQRFRLYPLGVQAWIWDKELHYAEHQGADPL